MTAKDARTATAAVNSVGSNGHNGNHALSADELADIVSGAKLLVAYVAVPHNPYSAAIADRMGFTPASFFPRYGPPGEAARLARDEALREYRADPKGTLEKLVTAAGYKVESWGLKDA